MVKKKETISKFPKITKPKFEIKPAPRLTQEQFILGEMFGGGDGCVLGGKDGEGLPRMNHALNPGQLGEDGTAEMFGFGGRPQRSGLF